MKKENHQNAKWQQKQDENMYSEEDLLKFGAFVRIEVHKKIFDNFMNDKK